MKQRRSTRGRPLIALGLVLASWVVARMLFWNEPAFAPIAVRGPAVERLLAVKDPPTAVRGAPEDAAAPSVEAVPLPDVRLVWPVLRPPATEPIRRPLPAAPLNAPRTSAGHAPGRFGIVSFQSGRAPVGVSIAHSMLLMAARQMPFPVGLAVPFSERAAAPFLVSGHEAERRRRWSGDGWLLLREGGGVSLATGVAPATYGASQAGAVLRYRLAPESRHRPAAYLRATAALNGSGEKEAALGLSARPLRDVPVVAAAELRATARPGATRVRPAAMLVTEFPPFELPHKLRAEAYAQAGYVGGRNATPFVDGQLRVDRGVATIGRAELRTGGGVWGGAQKGAARLDIGPAATMGMGLSGSASARLAVDWRFRVGGNAAPSSGPALTLSAGF